MLRKSTIALFALSSLCFAAPSQAQSPDKKEEALRRKADRIHLKALTLDTHADVPTTMVKNPDFDISHHHDVEETGFQIDYPRMEAGAMDAMFFAVYLGQGPRTPEGHAEAKRKALVLFDHIHRAVNEHPKVAELATVPADAERIVKKGKHAVFIGIENGWPIGNDLSLVKTYYDLGARYITLTHSQNNDIGDSSTDPNGAEYNGLSAFGEQVVAEMNRLGMLVDVSHVSDSTFFDVMRLTKSPVIASHSSARALADHPRNMSDEMLQALANNGGVIQMNMVSSFLMPDRTNPARTAAFRELREKYGPLDSLSTTGREQYQAELAAVRTQYPQDKATLEMVVDHIDHVVKLVGIDHVGIGADLDGGGGVKGMNDVSEMGNITRELVRRGYSAKDIRKIWSGNLFRVMREAEKVAQQHARSGAAVTVN